MAEATSTGTTFTLKEEGGGVLTLTGRALPYLPLSITGKQRAEFTWYPGSPAATVQMLGPEEGAITIRGFWKDKFLAGSDDAVYSNAGYLASRPQGYGAYSAFSEGTPFESCAELVQTVDTMRRMGRRITLAWDTIIRYGHITSFTQTWYTPNYCEWEMEFTVAAQEAGKIATVVPNSITLPDAAARTKSNGDAAKGASDTVIAAAGATVTTGVSAAAAPAGGGGAAPSTVATLSIPIVPGALPPPNLLEGIKAKLAEFDQIVTDLTKVVTDAAQQGINTINQVNDIVSTAANIPRKTVATLFNSATTLAGSVGQVTNTALSEWYAYAEVFAGQDAVPLGYQMGQASYRRMWANTWRSLIYSNVITADIMTQQMQQELQSQYVPQRDMDMRDISTQVYGTPNYWQQLMMYNGRSSSLVRAGTTIYVPNDPSYFGAGLPSGGST